MSKTKDQARIKLLISQLADPDGRAREEARHTLVAIGRPAVAQLVECFADPRMQVRWEAAKALIQIGDPAAVPTLIKALEDEDFGVRWLAAEGLINAEQAGLVPLLQALLEHSNSVWLREGAHHVLRGLARQNNLYALLTPVIDALDDLEPALEVPIAAEQALKALEGRAA